MITNTNAKKFGGTVYVRIPPHLVQYLSLEDNIEIEIPNDNGKHGKFISFWTKEKKEED